MISITRTSCLCFLICLAQDATAQLTHDFPELLTRQSFGLRGNVARAEEVTSWYRTEGQKIAVTNLVFDEKGRIDSLSITDTNKIHTLKVFHYGGDSLLSSRVIYTGRKSGDSSAFLYNKSGRLREIQEFSLNGNSTGRIRYRYDGEGRLNYIMKNDGDNKLLEIIRFKYPARDEYIRTVFNENQQYVSGIHFMYSGDTSKSQWTRFYYRGTPDSCTGIEDITFNKTGQETRRIVMTAERRMTGYSTCNYNATGDPEEKTDFSEVTEKDIQTRYEYSYDPSGNWIRQTTYTNDTLQMVTAREIAYRNNANGSE